MLRHRSIDDTSTLYCSVSIADVSSLLFSKSAGQQHSLHKRMENKIRFISFPMTIPLLSTELFPTDRPENCTGLNSMPSHCEASHTSRSMVRYTYQVFDPHPLELCWLQSHAQHFALYCISMRGKLIILFAEPFSHPQHMQKLTFVDIRPRSFCNGDRAYTSHLVGASYIGRDGFERPDFQAVAPPL